MDAKTIKQSPYLEASWLSRLCLWWMNPVMKLGYQRTLTLSDMPDAPPSETSRDLLQAVLRHWQQGENNTSLFRVFLTLYRKLFVWWGLCICVTMACQLAQPVLIGYVLSYLRGSDSVTQRQAYMCAGGQLLCFTGFSTAYTIYVHNMYIIGMRARSVCTALLYKKVLRTSLTSLRKQTTGQIINLLAADVEIVCEGMYEVNFLWYCPMVVVIVFTLLFVEFGLTFLAGFFVILLLLILMCTVGAGVGKNRLKVSNCSDKRNGVMNDILTAIYMTKMFCWEEPFARLIEEHREKELASLRKCRHVETQVMLTYFTCAKVGIFVMLVTSVLTGNDITPTQALLLLGWMEFARLISFGRFPVTIICLSEMKFSLQRIQVMSGGRVAEFDHPHLLFQNPNSHLLQLAQQTGSTERQVLETIARTTYLQKHAQTSESPPSISEN